jgi:4-amino-4-deoxy-L-arabinose transferase-like glycosyltransferase
MREERNERVTVADPQRIPQGLAWVQARVLSWDALPWLVIAAGAALRLARWLDNRSLWLDESFLALNLIDKSWTEIVGQLDYEQGAPPGFLLIESASVALFGDGERALRLFPLIAAIASLFLFHAVARRFLRPLPALLALVLFATNESLLYYSSEVKPYASDVAVGLLLVLLYLRFDARAAEGFSASRLLPLALAGIGAVWLSFPAAFVLAAIFAAFLVRAWQLGQLRAAARLAPVAVLLVASFLALFAVASRNITFLSTSLAFGEAEDGGSVLKETVQEAWSTIVDPIGFKQGTHGLAALLALFGVLGLARRDRLARLALLVVPLVLAFVAAAIGKYPLGGRFSLFLVPFALLLVVRGVHELVNLSRKPALVAAPIAVFLALPTVAVAARQLVNPVRRENVRPVLEYVAERWHPGDALYVYRNAQYALRYYAECKDCGVQQFPWPTRPANDAEHFGFPPALASVPPAVSVGQEHESRTEDLLALDRDLPDTGRVWMLFAHVLDEHGLDDETLFTTHVSLRGRFLDGYAEPGAAVYLVELLRPAGTN